MKINIFSFFSLLILATLCYSCKTSKGFNQTGTTKTATDTLQDSSKLAFYKGDTIAYVNYIVKNQAKYVGKPLSVLLNDLDFKVHTFGTTTASNNKLKVFSITLSANPYNQPGKLDKNGINQNIELGVGWQTYVPKDSIKAIIVENGPPDYYKWSKRAEEYFGKQIVGNLWLNYYMKR